MKTTSVVPTIAVLLGGASLLFASPAFAEEPIDPTDITVAVAEGVCDPLDSGKIDLGGGKCHVQDHR